MAEQEIATSWDQQLAAVPGVISVELLGGEYVALVDREQLYQVALVLRDDPRFALSNR